MGEVGLTEEGADELEFQILHAYYKIQLLMVTVYNHYHDKASN